MHLHFSQEKEYHCKKELYLKLSFFLDLIFIIMSHDMIQAKNLLSAFAAMIIPCISHDMTWHNCPLPWSHLH